LKKKKRKKKNGNQIFIIFKLEKFNDYSILNKIPNNNIKSLEFNDSNIKDSELSYLSSSLENLILNNCYELTNKGIKNLPTSLKSLEIGRYGHKLNREIIKYLPKELIELKIKSLELENYD
jgi:hypothetical protein